MKKEVARQIEIIKENAVDVICEEELEVKITRSLKKKEPLRLKAGFDPTSGDIHLGHTVLLRKLRRLQDLGHTVYFIIGDFTAKIGDPSGRTASRPVLNDREIRKNAATYTRQAFKILNKKQTKVIYNSVWYKKMRVSQFLCLLSSYTVARLLERDDFSKRISEKKPLTLLEFNYPLIQGYDSYKLNADIEFGGTDQKFNLIVGRHLQEAFGQVPQSIVTTPLLVGLDGKNKMSKSLGNYVGITEAPKQMFGKLMSISDVSMWEYFRLLTLEDVETIKKMHPKQAKLRLAQTITAFYYSEKIAVKERDEFERVFSQKEIPQDIPVYALKTKSFNVIDVLYEVKLVDSKRDGRRILEQGGISLSDIDSSDSRVVKDPVVEVPAQGAILKIGKKKFLKVNLT